MSYHQLGGFRPTIFENVASFNTPVLVEKVAALAQRDGSLEMVLGIRPSGASCLLIPVDQTGRLYLQKRWTREPLSMEEFDSLSPIYFRTLSELSVKLAALAPKFIKGKRATSDTSQANKQYTASGSYEGVRFRSFVEHGRVFWRVLQQQNPDHQRFGLRDISWKPSVRVLSFTMNTWSLDNRPLEARTRTPRLLDVAWSEAEASNMRPKDGVTRHFTVHENKHMVQQGVLKTDFSAGATEILAISAINSEIRELFRDYSRPHPRPIILLVNGEGLARTVINNAGMDTGLWKSGFKDLLGFNISRPVGGPRDPRRRPDDLSSNAADRYRDRPRSRSRSPRRDRYRRSRSPPRSSSYTPSSRRTYTPVHIIDVKELAIKVLATQQDLETSDKIAKQFGLSDAQARWCAGNEAMQIFEVFHKIISGPAIDEQIAHYSAARSAIAIPQLQCGPSSAAPDPPDVDDDDRDPNDLPPAPAFNVADTNEYFNDDFSDYGGSDSDD